MTPSEFSALIRDLERAFRDGTARKDRLKWLDRLGTAMGTAIVPMNLGETYHVADVIAGLFYGAILLHANETAADMGWPSPLAAIVHPVNPLLLAHMVMIAHRFHMDHVARALWRSAGDDLHKRHLAVMYKAIHLWQLSIERDVLRPVLEIVHDMMDVSESRTIN